MGRGPLALGAAALLSIGASDVTFDAPTPLPNSTAGEHGDHAYAIPDSKLRSGGPEQRALMVQIATKSGGRVALSGSGGETWKLAERGVGVTGLLIPHNRSCSKTFGSIGLEGGTVNADLDPTTTFVSNFTEFYCADEASGEVTVTREPAQLALSGLPFNVIQLNVAEADLAVLPSGEIVVTPYMWISDAPKSEMPMAQYGCCLNWTCPCPVPAPTPTNPRPEDHCSCPPRVQHPCAPGTFGPSTKHPKYLLRQMFLLILSPFRSTDLFCGAGTSGCA